MSIIQAIDKTGSKVVKKTISIPIKIQRKDKEYFNLIKLIKQDFGNLSNRNLVDKIKELYIVSPINQKETTLIRDTMLGVILLFVFIFGFISSISYISF